MSVDKQDHTGTLDPLTRLREGVNKNPRARRAELARYLEAVAPGDKIKYKHDPSAGRYSCSVDMWMTGSRTPVWVVGDLNEIKLWCIDRDAYVVQREYAAARGWIIVTGRVKCGGAEAPSNLIGDLRVIRVGDDAMAEFATAVKAVA